MTGGYVNLPVALAAWLRRLNSVIYLPDIEPGSSIRFLTRFVRHVATTTSESEAYLPSDKMVVTGYPVRDKVRRALSMSQAEARAGFDLQPDRPTLFVFGGSRGAQSINQALVRFLPELLSEAQVIHISGTLTWEETSAFAGTLPPSLRRFYRPFPYLEEEMGAAFRAADLVLARAGASMLGESPSFGLASILVPYPYAWRYQKVNADYLASRGAAIRIDDEEMGEKLLPAIRSLLFNPERRQRMSQAASELDNPDAARRLAKLLLSLEGNSHG
jgi:UDP-N-acetylglucosamine--N-acetylmuramyl-(pentapeptide) pyrophosphoryl-undecaprenol N-acetylglucosamine transferase